MTQENDYLLLQQLKNDNQKAFKQIFDAHYDGVCRAIGKLIPDQALAEELTQNVFIQFWNKRHQLQIKGTIAPYIRRMGINEALAQLRKKQHTFQELPVQENATANSVEETYLQNELQGEIKKAVNELPQRCKTIFVLSRFEQLSHKEIGEKLDIKPKTVENQITIALKTLRKALKNYLRSLLFLFF